METVRGLLPGPTGQITLIGTLIGYASQYGITRDLMMVGPPFRRFAILPAITGLGMAYWFGSWQAGLLGAGSSIIGQNLFNFYVAPGSTPYSG